MWPWPLVQGFPWHGPVTSHSFRTRESVTPVPFYCTFLLMLRLKAAFVFISFCKAPAYVSGWRLRSTQVLVSRAGSRLGKRKPSSGPSWPPSNSGLQHTVVQVKILTWFLSSTWHSPGLLGSPTCSCMADMMLFRPFSQGSPSSQSWLTWKPALSYAGRPVSILSTYTPFCLRKALSFPWVH